MEQISQRVQSLAPSQTLAMSQKSQELKAQGVDVINLSVGDLISLLPLILKMQPRRLLMIISLSILRCLVICLFVRPFPIS